MDENDRIVVLDRWINEKQQEQDRIERDRIDRIRWARRRRRNAAMPIIMIFGAVLVFVGFVGFMILTLRDSINSSHPLVTPSPIVIVVP